MGIDRQDCDRQFIPATQRSLEREEKNRGQTNLFRNVKGLTQNPCQELR